MNTPPKVPRVRKIPDPGSAPQPVAGTSENLVTTALVCIHDGTFDTFFDKIQARLVVSARTGNARDTAYYTRAFKSFLVAKGGSYARRPKILDAAERRLPAAAFEPFDD
jgi:hypothetical protein